MIRAKAMPIAAMAAALVAVGLATANARPPQAPDDDWGVNESVSKLDDSKSIMLMRTAETRRGRNYTGMFSIFCHEGSKQLLVGFIVPTGYGILDGDEFVDVTTRVDKDQPKALAWKVAKGRKAATLTPSQSITFIRRLRNAEALVVHAPLTNGTFEEEFKITGLEGKMHHIARSECGWPKVDAPTE